MKVLIAGGAGFIGTNLSIDLVSEGHEVVILDNFSSSHMEKISSLDILKKTKQLEEEICKSNFESCDVFINLACPASPPRYQYDPLGTLEACYTGTKNILNFCLSNKIKLIHASTSEIYGDPKEHPQKEDYFGNVNSFGPRSCYDEGKRVSETLCYEYKKLGLDVNVIRIFNTYGPFMDYDDGRVISNFINQAIKNKEITIYGDGQQTRSFCYIDDLISGIKKIIFSNKNLEMPINFGNPDEYEIREIANMVISITRSNSKIKYLDLPINDPLKRKPCIENAKNFFSWQPEVTICEGLNETIKYFKGINET